MARSVAKSTSSKSTVLFSSSGSSAPSVGNMKATELANILRDADVRSTYQIIDVREAEELEMVSLKGDDIINLSLGTAGDWSPKVR